MGVALDPNGTFYTVGTGDHTQANAFGRVHFTSGLFLGFLLACVFPVCRVFGIVTGCVLLGLFIGW